MPLPLLVLLLPKKFIFIPRIALLFSKNVFLFFDNCIFIFQKSLFLSQECPIFFPKLSFIMLKATSILDNLNMEYDFFMYFIQILVPKIAWKMQFLSI